MTAEQVIAEMREFASREKERWLEHRDRQKPYGYVYGCYNGRWWMSKAFQDKLSTIARKQARHSTKAAKGEAGAKEECTGNYATCPCKTCEAMRGGKPLPVGTDLYGARISSRARQGGGGIVKLILPDRTETDMTDQKILNTMEKCGGSFASSLAVCFMNADSTNFIRLRLAFNDLWEKYDKMAEMIEARDKERSEG